MSNEFYLDNWNIILILSIFWLLNSVCKEWTEILYYFSWTVDDYWLVVAVVDSLKLKLFWLNSNRFNLTCAKPPQFCQFPRTQAAIMMTRNIFNDKLGCLFSHLNIHFHRSFFISLLYFEVDVVIITSVKNAPHWFLHSAPRPAQ